MQFINKNHLSTAGFYYTDLKDIVCCSFCGLQVGQWKEVDDPFKEHQRCNPSCGYIKGLFVGNIPVGSTNQQSTRSRDVCGSWRSKYNCLYLFFCYVCILYTSSLIFSVFFTVAQPWVFKHKIREQKTSEWCSPLFPQYRTISARMQSFNKWPLSSKRHPKPGFSMQVKILNIVC